jgi:predicted Zn-dependent protease
MGEAQRQALCCAGLLVAVGGGLALVLPPTAAAGTAVLAALALALAWPSLGAWAVERLEHELDLRLAANRRVGLVRLVDRDPLVRALAPDWYLVARRGTLANLVGDHRGAVPLLRRAIEICPDDDLLPLRDELAQSMMGCGQDKEAEQLLKTMIAEGAETPERLGMLGQIWLRRNQASEAISFLERGARGVTVGLAALRIRTDLADAYARAGRIEEAEETLRAAREVIVPDNADLKARLEKVTEVVERAAATMKVLQASRR